MKNGKMKSKSFDTLVDSLDAEIDDKRRWEYIKKFSIAQSLIGIDRTLEWKRKIMGSTPLEESSLEDLDKLIKKLRGVYRWQREKQQESS